MKRKLLYILLTLSLIGLLFTGCKEDKATQTEPTADTVVVEKQLLNKPRWVTADPSLRMRDSAGSEGTIIGNIPLGEEVTLLEESGDELTIAGATGRWSRVKWQQLEGWVFGGFLTTEKPVVAEKSDYEERDGWISEVAGATLFSNVDNILTENPITTIITHLDYGTKVTVIGEKMVDEEQFYVVRTKEAKEGYVYSESIIEKHIDIKTQNEIEINKKNVSDFIHEGKSFEVVHGYYIVNNRINSLINIKNKFHNEDKYILFDKDSSYLIYKDITLQVGSAPGYISFSFVDFFNIEPNAKSEFINFYDFQVIYINENIIKLKLTKTNYLFIMKKVDVTLESSGF